MTKTILLIVLSFFKTACAQVCPDILYPDDITYNGSIGLGALLDPSWVINNTECIGNRRALIGGVIESYDGDLVVRTSSSSINWFNVIVLDRNSLQIVGDSINTGLTLIMGKYTGISATLHVNTNMETSRFMFRAMEPKVSVIGE